MARFPKGCVMECILNTDTKTVHKRCEGENAEATVCGSLKFVSRARTQTVSIADLHRSDAINRCGNCFEEGGGY